MRLSDHGNFCGDTLTEGLNARSPPQDGPDTDYPDVGTSPCCKRDRQNRATLPKRAENDRESAQDRPCGFKLEASTTAKFCPTGAVGAAPPSFCVFVTRVQGHGL
jgi:hypothetical protein